MNKKLFVAAVLGCVGALTVAQDASAADIFFNFGHRHGGDHYRSYYGRRSGPIYHAPSIRYDRVYHEEYRHWTPSRGYHSHGHFDYVPRYVPGHFDYQHRNHIHLNRRFH